MILEDKKNRLEFKDINRGYKKIKIMPILTGGVKRKLRKKLRGS